MKTFLITIAMTLATMIATAQLKGSGKTITKNYDYSNFDKVSFEGFNDDIQIEIGSSFKVVITMKEDNEKNIQFKYNKSEMELALKVKAKTGMELYDERDTYQIKVYMPEISVIKNFGNSNITIKGIIGRYFRVEATGNGDVICSGSIDKFDVEKSGNGNVEAKKFKAINAKISNIGNGDVVVNVSENLEGKLVGNGNIQNLGKAKFNSKSSKKGNGDLISN